MDEINDKTKIALPVKAAWTISISFLAATVWLVGLYGEVKVIPTEVQTLKSEIADMKHNSQIRQRREYVSCLVLKNIQNQTVPASSRIELECE